VLSKNQDKAWEEIRKLLAELSCHSPSEMHGVDALRETWEENKSWLFPYFDDEGRVEMLSSDSLDGDDYEDAMRAAKNGIYKVYENRNAKAHEGKQKLVKFSPPSIHNTFRSIANQFRIDELKNNSLSTTKTFDNDYSKGMKVSKVMKSLVINKERSLVIWYPNSLNEENAEELAELVTTEYSLFRTELDKTGTRCVLSVNPLDILMASISTTGWSTCHNITNGSCKAGPFSYLLDEHTIIGYAYRGKENYSYYNYVSADKLPVKKWRLMVSLCGENKAAVLGRQFTGIIPEYERCIRKLSAEVLAKHCNEPLAWTYKSFTEGCRTPKTSDDCGEVRVNDCYFNDDLLEHEGSQYNGDYPSAVLRLKSGSIPYISVGYNPIPCAVCEEEIYDCSGKWICDNCYSEVTCNFCGGRFRKENLEEVEGQRACKECLPYQTATCVVCGERHLKNTMYGGVDGRYCTSCVRAKKASLCSRCGTAFRSEDITLINGNNYCSACAERYKLEKTAIELQKTYSSMTYTHVSGGDISDA
jgi:hypothetical protein